MKVKLNEVREKGWRGRRGVFGMGIGENKLQHKISFCGKIIEGIELSFYFVQIYHANLIYL